MRSTLLKTLKREFHIRFSKSMDDFTQIRKSGLTDGSRIYVKRFSQDSFGFVKLQPHTRYDSFTVELAWSKTRQYPSSRYLTSPAELMNSSSGLKPICIRIGRFNSKVDRWWWFGTPVETNIKTIDDLLAIKNESDEFKLRSLKKNLEEVFALMKRFSNPFFEQVVSSNLPPKL